jgi:hypothetical protein
MICSAVLLRAVWREIDQVPQPKGTSIVEIHDFTIALDGTRYLLADREVEKSLGRQIRNAPSWMSALKETMVAMATSTRTTEIKKNVIFSWQNNQWIELEQHPPFMPHALHCIGTILYALAYDNPKSPTQTKILIFEHNEWNILETPQAYTVKESGHSVAIAGNSQENIWITFEDSKEKQTSVNVHVSPELSATTVKRYPYHSVSIGWDGSLWALGTETDMLITAKNSSDETSEKIVLSDRLRKSNFFHASMITKVYAFDKNTCYGLDSNGSVYQWNTLMRNFSPLQKLGDVVALGFDQQMVIAINREGKQYGWIEFAAEMLRAAPKITESIPGTLLEQKAIVSTLQEDLQRQKKLLLPVRPRTVASVPQMEVAGPASKKEEPYQYKMSMRESSRKPSPNDPFWKTPKVPTRVIKMSPPNTVSVAAILRHMQQVIRDYFHEYRPRWLSSLFPQWFPIPIR